MKNEFLWVEKYRPKTVNDTILPKGLKQTFQEFVNQKNVPNLLLSGGPGVGKTTIARAMLEELGATYLIINGSMNGNIDTLRNEIRNFASSVSLDGNRKYVILDEADYLNAQSTQPALRNFMEEFSKNCGFILTCNFKNRIIEPLQSRCSVIDFVISNDQKPKMATQFYKRVVDILSFEQVEFEPKAVAALVEKYFPDWRRALNEMQRYSATGKIDTDILVNVTEQSIKQLVGYMKEKSFTSVRKWTAENSDSDFSVIVRRIYDTAADFFKPQSIPQLILILANYQYKHAFVADPEINTVAMLTEIMVECEFK